MSDDELVKTLYGRAADLTAERNKTTDDKRWALLNQCVVFLTLAADRISEL